MNTGQARVPHAWTSNTWSDPLNGKELQLRRPGSRSEKINDPTHKERHAEKASR